jgi:hypothetical protein
VLTLLLSPITSLYGHRFNQMRKVLLDSRLSLILGIAIQKLADLSYLLATRSWLMRRPPSALGRAAYVTGASAPGV